MRQVTRMPAISRRTAAMIMVGVLVTAGAMAGADPAVGAGPLGYTCQFPTGPEQVGVTISATVPEQGTAGSPIQPDAVAATVTLPPNALAALTALGAASVTGKVNLTV